MLSEKTAFLILVVGLAMLAIGQVWMIVRAFYTHFWWGVAVLLLPIVGVILFTVYHVRRSFMPWFIIIIGMVVAGVPLTLETLFTPPKVAQTEQTQGEERGTLTGATETAAETYIREHQSLAVLQMANRDDVTDSTLSLLTTMPNLRELDLNDTPITDDGLKTVATLNQLETLRIARTQVTPAGVEKHILTLPKLRQLDVSGLSLPGKSLRDWKNADPTNRKYVK